MNPLLEEFLNTLMNNGLARGFILFLPWLWILQVGMAFASDMGFQWAEFFNAWVNRERVWELF